MTHSGNLAEPLRGQLDAEGRLISADPPLMRLHLHSGGFERGPLAIPSLARLCRLSKKLGMSLSRSVRAADGDKLIELWVETRPDDEGLVVSVIDWIELGDATISDREMESRRQDIDRLNALGEIRTDAAMRVMAFAVPAEEARSEDYIGQDLMAVLNLNSAAEKRLGEAIEERQPVRDQTVAINAIPDRAYQMTGGPLINGSGLFAGYRFRLSPVQSAHPNEPEDANQSEKALINSSLFGAQLGPALRQPLGKIIANAETIGSQLEGPLRGDYAGYAKDIAAAGRHLMDLVDDLSDLEAIERPDFSVATDDIDLVDLAHRAAGLLAVKASDHQIRIDLPPDDRQVSAKGEFRRVLQILVNLIGNAIRYSPDGSVIKIQAKSEGETASISVTDQGDGIAVEDRERIFEKFERLGRSGDGGTGLGLFISRRLARAMGGDLSVTGAPGKGAIFNLDLPAALIE